MKYLDFDWRELSNYQKRQVYKQYQKTANRRLRRLRESGYSVPITTREFLDQKHRKNFPVIPKDATDWQINQYMLEITNFLGYENSTLTGINKIINQVRQRIENRLNEFREEGKLEIKLDNRNFYNFLHSRQFKRLKEKIDSDILVEDYNDKLENGKDLNQILKEYENYLNEEVTWDEIRHKKGSAFQLKE